MTLENLCELIELQDEIKEQVFAEMKQMDFAPLQEHILALTKPGAIKAYIALSEIVGDEFPSIKMLCCYLRAALITYENYQKLGIDDEIYIETMKFFTRFIGECLERRGKLGFDRAAWSQRHLNLSIVRIGTLEYEFKDAEDKKVVSVHIPSGADLSFDSLKASFVAARKFIKEKMPEFADAPFVCGTWLLFDRLKDFLNPNSKILQFQSCFDIEKQYETGGASLSFIFQKADCSDYNALPEKTSLQRKLKEFLLSGGVITSGYGVVKEGIDQE